MRYSKRVLVLSYYLGYFYVMIGNWTCLVLVQVHRYQDRIRHERGFEGKHFGRIKREGLAW
jgi:hypothetical protein